MSTSDIPIAVDQPQIQEDENASTEIFNNVKVSLAELCAKGTSLYALKNYNEASDCYARAAELQAELNGDTSSDNAEILFLYGRSLFKVGQLNSDLLGAKAAGQATEDKKRANGSAKPAKNEVEDKVVAGEATADTVSDQPTEKSAAAPKKEDLDAPSKPGFSFEGDENFEDSDDDGAHEQEDGDEEDDDFANAFEALELARVMFEQKLKEPESNTDKGKAIGDSPVTKHVKERLAETHDLLAEISLENERFPSAVEDFRASLKLKEALYPFESEIVAEAWFKLSLALEFGSITEERDENDEEEAPVAAKESNIDEAMREESAKALEKAIKSTKIKLHNWEVDLASTLSVDDNDVTIKKIADVKELITDMEQRLLDVRAKPVDVQGLTDLTGGSGALAGILGETLGENQEQIKARLEEAQKNAKDLTSLVRKKEKKPADSAAVSGNGKRKAEDDPAVEAKKSKVEDIKPESS